LGAQTGTGPQTADRRPHERAAPPRGATSALLFATAAASGGGPAAALRIAGETLVGRLVAQLASLGVDHVDVVTRPSFAGAVEAAAPGVRVLVSESVGEDLRLAAEGARAADGWFVVGIADFVAHREALAALIADPRGATAMLATADDLGAPFSYEARSRRGRIVSAASPYHASHDPNHRFLGVVKVAPADLAAFAEAAERLTELADGARPAPWDGQLDVRAGAWLAEAPDAVEVELQRAAAREDVSALLLVGMVRGGAFVSNSFVRELYWARPLSQAGVDHAVETMAGYDEDRVLLDSAVKAADGFFTTFFVSPYSKYIARWCARRGFTPNQVTSVSMLIGVAAAAAFATGHRAGLIAGALLLQAAFTTDCVDGQLARYTRTFTKLGAWLDSIFDRTKEYLVFAGLAIGASRAGDPAWLVAGAALTLQTVKHGMEFAWSATMHQQIAETDHPPLEEPLDDAALRARRVPDASGPQRAPSPRSRLRRLVRVWSLLDDNPRAIWAKRIVQFPIGERFAVISLAAALSTPRTALVVVLVASALAGLYTTTGRLLRSIAA
jgi:hypothetical protein